jgi:hypothetical protein
MEEDIAENGELPEIDEPAVSPEIAAKAEKLGASAGRHMALVHKEGDWYFDAEQLEAHSHDAAICDASEHDIGLEPIEQEWLGSYKEAFAGAYLDVKAKARCGICECCGDEPVYASCSIPGEEITPLCKRCYEHWSKEQKQCWHYDAALMEEQLALQQAQHVEDRGLLGSQCEYIPPQSPDCPPCCNAPCCNGDEPFTQDDQDQIIDAVLASMPALVSQSLDTGPHSFEVVGNCLSISGEGKELYLEISEACQLYVWLDQHREALIEAWNKSKQEMAAL